ncbi:hypothetical protein BESB_054020 [Besnoitia besnoiti]|uniref:Uncharacterized protein n=1 Tax=Besnoitia besnoiti TaxID=94643 RepID=A0A2A9MHL0_BESBE|nr:hypothetical protein BESB_054020 [Besnoitia besnoiti]PFH35751.1 hypothetical protein BESB_054020 [Besnoitia besnoiti]
MELLFKKIFLVLVTVWWISNTVQLRGVAAGNGGNRDPLKAGVGVGSSTSPKEALAASHRCMTLVRDGISRMWPTLYPRWPTHEEAEAKADVVRALGDEARRLAKEYHEQPETAAATMEWALTSCYRKPESNDGHRGDGGIYDLVTGGPGGKLQSRKIVFSLVNLPETEQLSTQQRIVAGRVYASYEQLAYKMAAALNIKGGFSSQMSPETQILQQAGVPEGDEETARRVSEAFQAYQSDWQKFLSFVWSRILGHTKYIVALRTAEAVVEIASLSRPSYDLQEPEKPYTDTAERLAECIAREGCLGDAPAVLMSRASKCVEVLGIHSYRPLLGIFRENGRPVLHKLFAEAYADRRALADFMLRNLRMVADAAGIQLSSTTLSSFRNAVEAGRRASQALLALVLIELETACESAVARGDEGLHLLRNCVTSFINKMPSSLTRAFLADKVDSLSADLQAGLEIMKPEDSYAEQLENVANMLSDILKELVKQGVQTFRFLLPSGASTPEMAELADMPRESLIRIAEAFSLSQYSGDALTQYRPVSSRKKAAAAKEPRGAVATVSLVEDALRIVESRIPQNVDIGQRFHLLSNGTGLSTRAILTAQSYRIALEVVQALRSKLRDPLAQDRIQSIEHLDAFILSFVRRITGEATDDTDPQGDRHKLPERRDQELSPATLYIQITGQVARMVKYMLARELVSELKIKERITKTAIRLPELMREDPGRNQKDFRRDLPMIFIVDVVYGCSKKMVPIILNDTTITPTCRMARGKPKAIVDCVSPSEELSKALIREPKLLWSLTPRWLSADGVPKECTLMQGYLNESNSGGDLKFLVMSGLEKYDCGKDTRDRDYWARYALKAEMLRSLYQRYAAGQVKPTFDSFILSMFGMNVKEFQKTKKVEVRGSKLLIQRTFQNVVKDRSYLAQCVQDEATFLNELGVSLQQAFTVITSQSTGDPARQTMEQLISIIRSAEEHVVLEHEVMAELTALAAPYTYALQPKHQYLIGAVGWGLPTMPPQTCSLPTPPPVDVKPLIPIVVLNKNPSPPGIEELVLHREHVVPLPPIVTQHAEVVEPREPKFAKAVVRPKQGRLERAESEMLPLPGSASVQAETQEDDCMAVVKLYHDYIEQSGEVKDVDALHEQAFTRMIFANTFKSLGLAPSSRNLQQFRFALCITCAKYLPTIMLEKLHMGHSPVAASFEKSQELCKELYRRQGWTHSPVSSSIQLNLPLEQMSHRIVSRLVMELADSQKTEKGRVVALCSGGTTLSLAYQDINATLFGRMSRVDGSLLRQWNSVKKQTRHQGNAGLCGRVKQDVQNLLKVIDPRAWAKELIGQSTVAAEPEVNA